MTQTTPAAAAAASTPAAGTWPETIAFDTGVRAIYGVLRDEVFTTLSGTLGELREQDPDDVRMEFDNAISEVAARLGMDDEVETRGRLGEIVLEAEEALDAYLAETTDR